ncbi:MAG: GNAT family N-acetyltransferase [Gemmataceae bacterium]|nr:GNAT family N-acetyltransferase [Gemmataceae bacterium]
MPLAIRRAVPADASTIVEFNRLLAEESEGKVLDLALLRPGVAAALADPHKCLYFVAEEEGRIVGQTMVTYEWSDWRNGWIWWIQSVYVRPEARRLGVFRALYEHIRQTARQEGAIGIRLYVEEDNKRAHETYYRLGMVRSGYFVLEHLPL